MKKLSLLYIFLYFQSSGFAQIPQFDVDFLNENRKDSTQINAGFDGIFYISERNVKPFRNTVILNFDYAQSTIKNPTVWTNIKTEKCTQISLILSHYPKNPADWASGYDKLIISRLKALFAIDPTLNDKNIKFYLELQDGCNNEEEAKKLFHGFVLKTTPIAPVNFEFIKDIDTIKFIEDQIPILGVCGYAFKNAHDIIEYNNLIWLATEVGIFNNEGDDDLAFTASNKGIQENKFISSLSIFKNQLYCQSTSEIYKLDTKKNQWSTCKLPTNDSQILYINAGEEAMIACYENADLFITKDGINWKPLPVFTDKTTKKPLYIGLSTSHWIGKNLFVSVGSRLFLTPNFGESWIEIKYTAKPDWIFSIEGTNEEILLGYFGSNKFLCSRDQGKTWRPFSEKIKFEPTSVVKDSNRYWLSSIPNFDSKEFGLYVFEEGKLTKIMDKFITKLYKSGNYIFASSDEGMIYRIELQ